MCVCERITMHLYPSAVFCVHRVLSESKLHISKHKIHVMLKLFSILSIALEIGVFKTRVIRRMDFLLL